MADQSVIEQFKQGTTIWNEWKAKQPTAPLLDLSGTDFAEINVHLEGMDLTFCNLRACNTFCVPCGPFQLYRKTDMLVMGP